MKSNWLFITGAIIDSIGLLAAIIMMLADQLKGTNGTNNPTMLTITCIGAMFVGGAFLLKNAGHIKLATGLLWIPGLPLLLYGVFILVFIIGKPDMR